MENSYIVDNIRDGLFVSNASADNYTSIINSYNFGKDIFDLITNVKAIIWSKFLPSTAFKPSISKVISTILLFLRIVSFNEVKTQVFVTLKEINFIVSKCIFLIRYDIKTTTFNDLIANLMLYLLAPSLSTPSTSYQIPIFISNGEISCIESSKNYIYSLSCAQSVCNGALLSSLTISYRIAQALPTLSSSPPPQSNYPLF